jgi:hypothetical protein
MQMARVDSGAVLISPQSRVRTAEVFVAGAGCALVIVGLAATQAWFDEHFLPGFFFTRRDYVRMEWIVRVAAMVCGAAMAIVLRRPLARAMAAHPDSVLSGALAVALAFGAAELTLRQKRMRAAEEVPPQKEPLRHLDRRLGWLFVPSHVGYQSNNGRRVQYAVDANGYRVRRLTDRIDFDAPSIVFAGESMMVGEKLLWPETIPARVASQLCVQSANVAVSGYATDQAYLRLSSELPRFRKPLAVVMLFTPAIFDRNLDDDRPHLGPHLQWLPPEDHWRLAVLARRIIRYRSADTIERGVANTREVLRATVQLAESRGAVPLIVVPQFIPEDPRERMLRERILDEERLPYVFVPIEARLRVPNDGHPNAAAMETIAAAVAARLEPAIR